MSGCATEIGWQSSLLSGTGPGGVPLVEQGRCSQKGAEFIFKFLKCSTD